MAAHDVDSRARVLICGAGPVGMTLALDLAARGVRSIVVERSASDAPPRQRCNHISARTMETFRQLGIAQDIREAGLTPDYPHDVAYVTTLAGDEMARIRIPSRRDRFAAGDYADAGWPTDEPPHRCNQMFFEPILRRHLAACALIETHFDTVIEAAEQTADGVRATGRDLRSGAAVAFAADYLVGCDGGGSLIRKAIGAAFEGDAVISGTRSVVVRAPRLRELFANPPAWMTWFINPDAFGCLVALNGEDLWAFHFWLPPGPPDFERVVPEAAIRGAAGTAFDYEQLSIDDWFGRRLVASRFRDRRMFICGDAAHIWIPFAGYGMNAGIADAMNLSWQLAGTIAGWGGPALLDGYEAERRPVTEQVSREVMAIAFENLGDRVVNARADRLIGSDRAAIAARAELGAFLYEANVGQFACLGLNFGTYYARSPLLAGDGGQAPRYGLGSYQPSTVPGCRTPYVATAGGGSLYDRLGPGFTLLRRYRQCPVDRLAAAAARRDIPLALVDLPPEASRLYDRALVLSRPDQHVAWRGDAEPADPDALLDIVAGYRPMPPIADAADHASAPADRVA